MKIKSKSKSKAKKPVVKAAAPLPRMLDPALARRSVLPYPELLPPSTAAAPAEAPAVRAAPAPLPYPTLFPAAAPVEAPAASAPAAGAWLLTAATFAALLAALVVL